MFKRRRRDPSDCTPSNLWWVTGFRCDLNRLTHGGRTADVIGEDKDDSRVETPRRFGIEVTMRLDESFEKAVRVIQTR